LTQTLGALVIEDGLAQTVACQAVQVRGDELEVAAEAKQRQNRER
jgi:hypothetical protein